MKTVSCIIPAYNEEKDIAATLSVVVPCIGTILHEVIVVNDASTDTTRLLIEKFPTVRIINHHNNQGKSKSVADGIAAATGDFIFLLDADLAHLQKGDIESIITPVLKGKADTTMVYIKNAWPLFPFKEIDYLSGQRVFAREILMSSLQEIARLPGYSLEVFLNCITIQHRLRLFVVPWPEVENNFNQHKQGWIHGVKAIIRIWTHVIRTIGIVGMYKQNLELKRLLIREGSKEKISFVIPAYNEEKTIGKCLESVFKEIRSGGYDAEIIVANNNSYDRTKEVAQSYGATVVDEMNQGIVYARKAGFVASSGTLIANIDADTVLPKGWLKKVMGNFDRDKDMVALSGPYIYYDLPSYTRAAVKVFYVFGYVIYLFNRMLNKGAMLQGGNFIIRREALLEIGGYDTSIEFYGEDTDVARRISKVGKVVWTFDLPMYTSGRRLMKEGVIKTGLVYAINFFWVSLFGKPFTKSHQDIRL